MELEATQSVPVAPRAQLGRPSKRTTSVEAVITVGRTTSSLAREIADVCQFPPARAAAGLLVLIFETIEGMRKNQERCIRLAERAATILIDVHDQMQGKWLDAPEPLVRNLKKFEQTLRSIHEFMLEEAGAKWKDRLLRKKNIDEAIHDYTLLLNDAARSFQIAALIDIHVALQEVADISSSDETIISSPTETEERPELAKESTLLSSTFGGTASMTIFAPSRTESQTETLCEDENIKRTSPAKGDTPREEIEPRSSPPVSSNTKPASPAGSGAVPDLAAEPVSQNTQETDHQLPRFHQSQVRLQPRAAKVAAGSWHAGSQAVRVTIPGVPPSTTVYMKRYDGAEALKRWKADAQMLISSKNPFMPLLVGVSDEKTPARFLLLVDRPQ